MTIIAFISQKGGVGKSTLARAVAVEAQKQRIKVLLADCDSQQSTSYEWTQWRKGKSLSTIPSQVFNSVKEVWPLASKYNLIIIDGPARTSQATQEIAEKADLVIQPIGASRDDLIPAVKEFNALVKNGISKKKLLFALTRLSTNNEAENIKNYLADTGYNYSLAYLYEKASYKQAQNEGKAVSEVNYKTLRRQAKELIQDLLKHLE
jgi:chromosome partitioning protein